MMRTVFDLAIPRSEVLEGELNEDRFAARLKDVIDGTADPVYQDAGRFFENTFPTAGLKTLLREVLGRLTGQQPASNPIIRLETSFGGGKTHNLIALYHAVKGNVPPTQLRPFAGDEWQLLRPGEADVVGVVGSDLDPASGIYHPADNLTTYTLWGELAYQLGKRSGYALAQESDRNKSAPGTGLFERLVGNRPTLIMIDEVARHLRVAQAVATATGKSNVAEQTVAFLMSLLEFAASQRQVVVVLTLASDADAFQQETEELRQALAEAHKVSARQERVLTPTGENEVSAIVVHRLFQRVDREGARETVGRYGAYYQEVEAQGGHVHERALRADYLHEFHLSYPFHPELIRVLNLRVATIPNFQRTRGALRLLAMAVRRLWREQPADTWLIHPYHINLADNEILGDLTSRLNRPKFQQVAEADIVSPQLGIPAHAAEADEMLLASGKPPYARQVATTIFLHSLTQGAASGVEWPELLLATATPAESGGDDPAVVKRALERLYEKAWYLEYDGFRYRFKTEPSLNKIIDDEMGQVGISRAKQEIDGRIRNIWRSGFLKPAYFPTVPAEVDDTADKPQLAILHYDAVKLDAANAEPPDLVRKLAEYKGVMESFREYRNHVLFLVADADQVEQMIQVARRYLAISRITGSADRMREFNDEHQKKLRKMGEAAELDVRVAITKAYRYLFYPAADAPRDQASLRRGSVPPQDQGDTNVDQTNVVVKVLRDLRKALTADESALAAAYVFSRAWERNQVEMTTEELRRTFARKIGLPILLDVNQLKKTIENGVKTGVWLYYDPREDFAYDKDYPSPIFQVSDETRLLTPAEASRLQVRIKGKWQPPQPPTPGGSGRPDDEDEPSPDDLAFIISGGRPVRLRGQGVPAQAFQQLRDQAVEHKAVALQRITLHFHGLERSRAQDLAAVGLAIPQVGKANFQIELSLSIHFGPGESLEVRFQGGWERYKRLKQVTDGFAREDGLDSLNVTMRLDMTFEDSLPLSDPQLASIQEILAQMNMGPIQLEALPVYEE